MLKPITADQIDRAWFVTNSLAEAIDALNSDISTMVACIPVKKDQAVTAFTEYLRKEVGTKWLPTHGQEASRRGLTHVFGQTPQLVTSEDTDQISS